MANRRVWTDQRLARLFALLRKGSSFEEAARALKCKVRSAEDAWRYHAPSDLPRPKRRSRPPAPHRKWKGAKLARLKRLHKEGLSTSEIASRLGVTRNTIIGACWRNGLGSGPKRTGRPRGSIKGPTNNAFKSLRKSPPKQSLIEPFPPEPVVPQVPLMIGILALQDNHCRWPIGDPRHSDFGFCGHPVAGGSPYCPGHLASAHRPHQSQEKAA